MTTLIKGENSYFMGAQAFLLDDSEREIASDWASKHVQSNPAIKWVLGRFVEANARNNNRQAWSLDDLLIQKPTINHAPMNMVHQARHIVGAYVATEMLYPTDQAAEGDPGNPYIEALGAFWRYYFPDEYKVVQKAHDEGSLFFSMECVAQSITFEEVASGRKQEFPYAGPFSDTYGEWNHSDATRWLNKPHFLAGALIVPPVKPGWSNATIKSLSEYMEDHQEIAEQVFASVKEQVPHLSSEQIEGITIGLMSGDIKEEWAGLVENSNSSVHLSNIKPDTVPDESASVSHPMGGDMDKTYTEDEFNAKLTELETLRAELDTLKAQADADAVDAQITELKAAHVVEVAEIQQKLDEAVIAANVATEERDKFVAWLEGEVAAKAEADLRASRTEERVNQVKEVANFSDEFVAENTERWVAMSDEDFEATVSGFKAAFEAAKASSKSSKKEEVNLATAMSGERDTANQNSEDRMGNVRSVLSMRQQGIDPRTL